MKTVVFACCLWGLLAGKADAQSLKAANIVFAASAVSDWTMTYRFLDAKAATETNPMLRPLGNQPAATVAGGAAIDVVSLWAWNRYVGRRHPRVAALGLLGMSAYRFDLARRGASVLRAQR